MPLIDIAGKEFEVDARGIDGAVILPDLAEWPDPEGMYGAASWGGEHAYSWLVGEDIWLVVVRGEGSLPRAIHDVYLTSDVDHFAFLREDAE